jgi:hypothetical protein
VEPAGKDELGHRAAAVQTLPERPVSDGDVLVLAVEKIVGRVVTAPGGLS